MRSRFRLVEIWNSYSNCTGSTPVGGTAFLGLGALTRPASPRLTPLLPDIAMDAFSSPQTPQATSIREPSIENTAHATDLSDPVPKPSTLFYVIPNTPVSTPDISGIADNSESGVQGTSSPVGSSNTVVAGEAPILEEPRIVYLNSPPKSLEHELNLSYFPDLNPRIKSNSVEFHNLAQYLFTGLVQEITIYDTYGNESILNKCAPPARSGFQILLENKLISI